MQYQPQPQYQGVPPGYGQPMPPQGYPAVNAAATSAAKGEHGGDTPSAHNSQVEKVHTTALSTAPLSAHSSAE
ncbi:hypothetical protein H4R33_002879 [Dimargaris cristalligena]|nr:hypothetical protein H4R33_002879 [Dimargaris cristalligena]